jgi:hypothetical protein
LVEEAKERFNHLLFIDLKKNFQEKRESWKELRREWDEMESEKKSKNK